MTTARKPSGRTLRRQLVEQLEASGSLTDPAVRKAFLAVPRERFLDAVAPGRPLTEVYADKAIVTRTDERGAPTSSSSQPAIMAVMLERLELRPGHRVLEIGAGTGYNAALLSTLVGEEGRVVSVELQADVAEAARAALAAGGHRAEVVTGDGRQGWAAAAPYDRIVVTASTGTVHRSWFDQLAPGGLLQLPLHLQGADLQAVVTLRKDGGRLRSTTVDNGGFMVLRDPDQTGRPGRPDTRPSGLWLAEQVGPRHRSLGSLTGEGMRRLAPTARRRLAGVLLEAPRAGRLPGLRGGPSPFLYLSLSRPSHAVVARYFRSGLEKTNDWTVALATLDGGSLAVLRSTRGRGRRLELFGGGEAEEALGALLEEWRDRGRPGTPDLRVTVRYGKDGRPRTTFAWP